MELKHFCEQARALGVLGFIVTKDNQEIARELFDAEIRRNVYSVSKSFTSVAVGIAVSEGLLSLDEKLTDAFAGELPETVSDNLARATVRDLLTMCLGHSEPCLMGNQRCSTPEEDWVRLALAVPLEHEPGSFFKYSNVGPYLAGILVQRRTGCTLVDYLLPRLFRPLGIKRPTWETDPQGLTFGASGLMLSLSELHRFALLCLNNGKWEGRQLIPEEWLSECRRQQGAAPNYSYLFWLDEPETYRADGAYGQYAIVLPEKNAAVSLVSECRDTASLQALIKTELFPQL